MNIIELAKQAGCAIRVDVGKVGSPWAHSYIITPNTEHFASLKLEEAAVECDKRAHAGYAGALMAARAIRALKGAKE